MTFLPTRRDDIRALLHRDDLTVAAIAKQAGVSRARIYQLARQEENYAAWLDVQREDAEKPFAEREVWFLPLSVRTRNALRHMRIPDGWTPPTPAIVYGRDLLQWTDLDLLHLRDFGRVCHDELQAFLAEYRR